MKTIVVYSSKYGYTKTYAEWISKELNCALKERKEITPKELASYDTIIYGGGLYASGINGIKLITQNFEELKHKKLIVWATGSCEGRTEELKSVWSRNFDKEQRKCIKLFYLRGGFDYRKLKGMDKMIMNLLKKKIQSTKEKTLDEEGLLHAYDVPENHCEKDNIKELCEYVEAF